LPNYKEDVFKDYCKIKDVLSRNNVLSVNKIRPAVSLVWLIDEQAKGSPFDL